MSSRCYSYGNHAAGSKPSLKLFTVFNWELNTVPKQLVNVANLSYINRRGPIFLRHGVLALSNFYTDVDECSQSNDVTSSGGPCGSYSTCLNTVGSYFCQCNEGYYLTNARLMQRPYCTGLSNLFTVFVILTLLLFVVLLYMYNSRICIGLIY